MSGWNKVGRVLRLWMGVAANGARLAYYLVGVVMKWGD